MNKKVLLLLIGLNVFFTINAAFAQDTLFNGRKNKIGFIAGNGIQYIGQLLSNDNHNIALNTDYYYQVTFYQLQYYHAISQKKDFGIDVLVQPQYNTTKYRIYPPSIDYVEGYEAGVNLGFLFRKNTSNNLLSFYLLISSGPHYVSGAPHRQSAGFVFANNLDAGLNLRLYKKWYLDIRPGIRHMSNAGLRIPNAGVNNMLLNEGFLFLL